MEESDDDDDDVSMADVSMAGSDEEVDAMHAEEESSPCIDEKAHAAAQTVVGVRREPGEHPQVMNDSEQPTVELEEQNLFSDDEKSLGEEESAGIMKDQVELEAKNITTHVDNNFTLGSNMHPGAEDATVSDREKLLDEQRKANQEQNLFSDDEKSLDEEESAGIMKDQVELEAKNITTHVDNNFTLGSNMHLGAKDATVSDREKLLHEQGKANQEMLKELEDLEAQLAARAKKLDEWEAELVSREAALNQNAPGLAPSNKRQDALTRTRLDPRPVEIPAPVEYHPPAGMMVRGEQTRAIASAGPRQAETSSSRCLPDTFLPDGQRCSPCRFWLNEGDTVVITNGQYRGMRASIRRFFGGRRLECGIEANGDSVLLRRDEVQLLESCGIAPGVTAAQRQQERKIQRQSTVVPKVQSRATVLQNGPSQNVVAQNSRGVKRTVCDSEIPSTPAPIIAKSAEEVKRDAALASSAAQSIINNQKRVARSVQSGNGGSMLRSVMRKTSKHANPENITSASSFSQLGHALDALLPGRKVDLKLNDRPDGVDAKAEDQPIKPKKQRTRAVKSDKAKRLLKDIDSRIQIGIDP